MASNFSSISIHDRIPNHTNDDENRQKSIKEMNESNIHHQMYGPHGGKMIRMEVMAATAEEVITQNALSEAAFDMNKLTSVTELFILNAVKKYHSSYFTRLM